MTLQKAPSLQCTVTLSHTHIYTRCPNPVPHNWRTLSNIVFCTKKKSTCDTSQDTHKTKSHHTKLRGAWILLRVCVPNTGTPSKSYHDTSDIHTNATKSPHTNVRWCVCTPTCVRTYHGTRRARHRRNKRKTPP